MHTLTLFTTQGHFRLCVVSNIGRDARSAGENTIVMIPSCHPKHNHSPAPLFLPVSGQDWRQRGRRDIVCATRVVSRSASPGEFPATWLESSYLKSHSKGGTCFLQGGREGKGWLSSFSRAEEERLHRREADMGARAFQHFNR